MLQTVKYINSTNRAYGFNWPYLSFSGFGNFLLLINAFDTRLFHRIEIAPKDSKITICDTYITDTMELFVIILQNDKYKLFSLDLERDKKIDPNKAFYSFGEPILEYSE